jgi:hypothetical protein
MAQNLVDRKDINFIIQVLRENNLVSDNQDIAGMVNRLEFVLDSEPIPSPTPYPIRELMRTFKLAGY